MQEVNDEQVRRVLPLTEEAQVLVRVAITL